MVDRDLRIGVTTPGSAEAKTELAGVNAELGKTAAAQDLAASSAEKQAYAGAAVGESLGRAQTAMGEFAVAAATGGKTAETALLAARDATAALEIAIANAKSIGAPVSSTAVSVLANYDAAIAAAVAETEALGVAQAGAGNQSRLLQAESRTASVVLGQYGRALGVLAGDHDNLAGSIARMILPIAAAIAGLMALNKVFSDLEAHGVDVRSASTLISDAMDGLRTALGGVSEAAKVNQDAFEKTRTGMRDVVTETQVFKTAMDLAAAAGINYAAGLAKAEAAQKNFSTDAKETASELAGVATGFELVESKVDDVGHAWDRALISINTLRSTMPITAAAYTKALQDMVAQGVDPSSNQFTSLTDAIAKTKAEMEAHTASMKAAYGPAWKEVEAALGKFSGTAQDVKDKIVKMKEAGLDYAAIVKALGPELSQLADAESKYGGELAKNDPQLQALILSLKHYWEGQDAVSKATEAAAKSLEKEREQTVKTAEDSVKAIEKMREKIAQLGGELEKNGLEFEKNIQKIEAHRQASIKAADDVANAAIRSVETQMAQTTKAYDAGEMSSAEYFSALNKLQGEELAVRRKTRDQEDKINQEAVDQTADLVTKDTDAKTKLIKNLADLNVSAAAAMKAHDALVESQKAGVAALQEQQVAVAAAKIGTDAHAESTKTFAKEVKAAAGEVGGHSGKLAENTAALKANADATQFLIVKMDGLTQSANAAAAALDKVTGGGGAPK
jgi:hypothetical protein